MSLRVEVPSFQKVQYTSTLHDDSSQDAFQDTNQPLRVFVCLTKHGSETKTRIHMPNPTMIAHPVPIDAKAKHAREDIQNNAMLDKNYLT